MRLILKLNISLDNAYIMINTGKENTDRCMFLQSYGICFVKLVTVSRG